ncbi:MAG: ATP-binding protein [Gemmatimonadales bacterium]
MTDTPTPAGRSGGLSISVKLPLAIGGLLILGVVIGAWVTFDSVRQAALRNTTERLGAVTQQLNGMLSTSAAQIRKAMHTAADTLPVQAFITGPTDATRAAALVIIAPPGQQKQTPVAEIRDVHGQLLLSSGDVTKWTDPAIDSMLVETSLMDRTGVIGHFHAVGDTVLFAVASPIEIQGRIRAILILWQRITGERAAREQLSGLIGPSARFYLGNPGATLWTDLVGVVPAPPIRVDTASGVLNYVRPDSGAIVSMARTVTGTPWVILIEFTRAEAMAGTTRFLKRLSLIGGIILVILLLGTWWLSRLITRPLNSLTRSVETVASGDYTQPIAPESADDEIVRLASAFQVMVHEVRESRHRLEERVEQRTAELKERNEELEAFNYSLAHDLRAPLRAMEGFSQALLEDYGTRLDATGRHYAELVASGAKTMDRMILDLLAYSRIARAELEVAQVNLPQVVRAASAQVAAEISARGAHVKLDTELPDVLGHAPTLVQVFANLLGNGIKFVPANRIPEVHIKAIQQNGDVRIWVEDNGIGIAPQYHEKIFRVFERLNSSEEYTGTGIGLAIVRKGIERMGGTVGLESEPGQGSRFWIELPRGKVHNND